MHRKLVAYTFSLAGMLGAATVATVVRFQTAQLGSAPAVDPLLAPAGPLFAATATASFALLEPRRARSRAAGCLARQLPAAALEASVTVAEVPLAAVAKEIGSLQRSSGAAASLRGAQHATVMTLRMTPPALPALAASGRVLLGCARETRAALADLTTGEVLTTGEWEERRVRSWAGEVPHVASHLTLGTTARADGLVEVTTVGLAKLGLPELYVRAPGAADPAPGRLLFLTAQVMLERGALAEPGRLTLDVGGLRHPSMRAAVDAAGAGGALGRTEVVLRLPADEAVPVPRAGTGLAIAAADGRRAGTTRRLELVLDEGTLAAAELQALVLDRLFGLPPGFERDEQAVGMRRGASARP